MIAANALRSRDLVPANPAAAPVNVVPLNPAERACVRVRRGARLYGVGDSFRVLYVVRFGFLKSLTVSDDGLMQVTGFRMTGDVIGFDGIDTGHFLCEVVALDDVEVFVLPFVQCERWSQESAHGQRLLMRTLAHEIARSQELMMMLGTMRAEQKLAAFLLDLSERYGRLGYSRSQFLLRMMRQDIASYLGLKLETVSRLMSRFQQGGLIQVQGRAVALLDFPALWRLSGISPDRPRPVVEPILDRDGGLLGAGEASDGCSRR